MRKQYGAMLYRRLEPALDKQMWWAVTGATLERLWGSVKSVDLLEGHLIRTMKDRL